MGGGGSTRRVTFEADENENITVVKGACPCRVFLQLSESVIDRMKEPSSAAGRQQRGSGAVTDEELKKRIAEELERARRDSEAQKKRLFGRLMDRERISSNEHLTRAVLRERAAAEEERQKAQHFVSPL
ncbi:MIC19 protein, partial [Phainopepla nitens]|nr:MIC19 protein [Phainopepla nitens]